MKDKKVFKKSSKSTIVAVLIGFILLFQFLLPSRANASLLGGATKGFVQDIVVWVLLFIKTIIVSGIMKLAAWLTAASLSLSQGLSTSIADPTSFVYVGWGIFRDIANLGFVFGIILIALATILRIQRYQAQSILSKLIVAALIVNFSLVICGAILKVSDVFSNSFLGYITQNQNIKDRNDMNQVGSATAKEIADKTSIALVLSNTDSIGSVTSTNASSTQQTSSLGLGDIVNVFIQIIIAIFVAFVLLVLAVMFLLRYFNLAFLMILAPGAWLMWIFPIAYRYWRDWWTHFLKWVFFAPLMLLFIWLTVVAMNSSTANILNIANGVSAGDATTSGFSSVLLSLMGVALLIGGLKIASSLGMAGSNFILKQSGKVTGWAKSKTTQYAKRGSGAAAAAIGRGIGVEKIGARMSTFAGKIKVPGVGWVARETVGRAGKGLISAGAAAEKRKAEPVFGKPPESFVEEYKKWDKDRQREAYAGLPREEQLGLLMAMQQQGRLDSDTITAFGGIDEIVRQADYLKQGGRASASGKLEKSLGMSVEMMKAMRGDESFDYKAEAEKFYGKFNPEDWRTMSENIGKVAFGDSDEILGLGKEGTNKFRDEYLNNISAGQGRGIGATASRLNDTNEANMYRRLVEGIDVEKLGKITGEDGNLRDLKDEYIKALGPVEEGKGRKSIDYDKVVKILRDSDDPRMKQLANNLSKGMGSIIMSAAAGSEVPASSAAGKPETKK